MALNISEGQFVTNPVDPSAAIQRAQQTLWQRNMQNQRLNLMKEARQNQVSNEVYNETDPSKYYTGSVYDPVITQNLQQAKQMGMDLASKGAGVAEIQQAIGPLMDKIKTYSMTAKAVNQQIDATIKRMQDNKMDVGYKLGDAAMGAKQSALMKRDADGNLVPKDPSEINLSTNFLQDEIGNHPDEYTTNEALQTFAQHSGKSTRQNEVLVTQPNGNSVKKSVKVIGANWEVPEADAQGNIQMVPAYDHATNAGQVLHHTIVGADGKETDEPIRLFDEAHFDQMMRSQPAVADYIRGQVMQHIGEYKDANGKPVTMSSPVAKLIARGIAYKELASAGNSTVETMNENKVSPAMVNVHVYGDKEQQAYDSAMGRAEAKSDAQQQGLAPGKTNAVQAIAQVFNNNPNYMDGAIVKVGDQNVIDITSKMPKGELQYTNQFGKKQPFQGVYYDPAKREIIVKKMGGYEHYPEAQAGQLAAQIAEANGVPISTVKSTLASSGWNNGKFGSPGELPDVAGRANAQFAAAHQEKVQSGLTKLDAASDDASGTAALKGIDVPGGKIDAVSIRGGFKTMLGADKYAVDVKNSAGKISTLTFKDRAALAAFLHQGAPQPSKTTEELGHQYGF